MPVERVLLPPSITAGMNVMVLVSLAYMLRTSRRDPEPVLLAPEGALWRIEDGRHRFMAAVIAGRPDVLGVVRGPRTNDHDPTVDPTQLDGRT